MAATDGPKQAGKRTTKPERARYVAEEAVVKMNSGNKKDAKDTLDKATSLDKKVTNEVLKANRKSPV